MKTFVVVCALFAASSAAPNGYGGQTISMQPAGSPLVVNIPNNPYGSNSVTYTLPAPSYQAAPVTYNSDVLTFNPTNINYNGQFVTYLCSIDLKTLEEKAVRATSHPQNIPSQLDEVNTPMDASEKETHQLDNSQVETPPGDQEDSSK